MWSFVNCYSPQIDFEEVYFSEVNRGASRLVLFITVLYCASFDQVILKIGSQPIFSSLEDVTAAVKKNKVALRGVMGIPEVR